VKLSPSIDSVPVSRLRAHPENVIIFGSAEDSDGFDELKASIKKHGQWDPIVAKPDGVVLAGHRRLAALRELGAERAQVRWVDAVGTYRDELEYLIRSNTDRRHLTPGEIAIAFKRLRETPKADGGTRGKRGPASRVSGANTGNLEGRDEAAAMLGVSTNEARSLETVFATPGVPEELKAAVNDGKIKPTPAAKAVRAEVKRQGGAVAEPGALKAFAEAKTAPKQAPHEARVEDGAAKFLKAQAKLLSLYQELDQTLSGMPLKSVLGMTEHHEYASLVRDIAIRAWREIEAVNGATDVGRQMTLSVVKGGRS
jgi:hypothetical protein